MKILANRADLLALVNRAASAVSVDKSKPILTCVRFSARGKTLRVFGMDLSHSLDASGEVTVVDEGEEAIPARDLVAALKASDDEVVSIATATKGRVKVAAGASSFTLCTLDANDFPGAPDVDGGDTFRVVGRDFAAALTRMQAPIAPDDNKYGLNGIHLHSIQGGARLVATDGNRLAYAECDTLDPVPSLGRMLLPRSAMPLLMSACEADVVAITVAGRSVRVVAGGDVIVSRLMEADFPDYRRAVPTVFKRRVLVDRDTLASAFKRVSLMDVSVTVSITDEALTLRTRSVDRGTADAEVPCELTGEPVTIGVNARYVLDALAGMGAEVAVVEIGNELSPVRLTAEGVRGVWIVMPVRMA